MRKIITIICIFCLCAVSVFVEAGELSKRKAAKIINEHIGTFYFPRACKYTYKKSDKKDIDGYESTKKLSNLYESMGVRFSTNEDNNNFYILLEPTEKGISIKTDENSFWMPIGKRWVEKIINISGDTVYFSYWYDPNNVGKTYGYHENSDRKMKLRGRAKITYDIYLGQFIFKGFSSSSSWEDSQLYPEYWTYTKEDKMFFPLGDLD